MNLMEIQELSLPCRPLYITTLCLQKNILIEASLSTATDHWIYNNWCVCVCVCVYRKGSSNFWTIRAQNALIVVFSAIQPTKTPLCLPQTLMTLSGTFYPVKWYQNHWGVCSGSPISLGLEGEEGDFCLGTQPKNEIKWLWLSPDFALRFDQRQMVTVSHFAC